MVSLPVRGAGKATSARQLHLHRMRDAKVGTRPAHVLAEFDLDVFLRDGGVSFRLGDRIRLQLRVASKALATFEETPLSKDQTITAQADGRALVEATVPDTMDLRGWLKSYGPSLEVLGPPALREQIAEEVRQTASLYGLTGTSPPSPSASVARRSDRPRGSGAENGA